jgi:arylformamidase
MRSPDPPAGSPLPGRAARPARPAWVRALVVVGATIVAGCASGTVAGAPDGTVAPATSATTAPAVMACASTQTVRYASPAGVDPNLTSLDVFTPPAVDGSCADRPLVVWVHGGGWTSGDKTEYVEDKVALFNGAGYVFASVNYRLTDKAAVPPAPQHPVHDQDTADAVAWLVEHAAEIGVDPDQVAIVGHSAGGGIVSAIATDPAYLGAHGLAIEAIDCAASMDGEGYDVVFGATGAPVEVQTGYRNVFGNDPVVWEQASPINHIVAGAGIADFFVAARGTDWRLSQHLRFLEALDTAGVPTVVLDSRSLEHADLATDIGAPDDTVVTPALLEFLGACFEGS